LARYNIVPKRSQVWIHARSSLHAIDTSTDGLEGWLDLEAPAGHLELPVEKLRSGNPLEDRELKRRIDSRRFPTIEGNLSSMKETEERDVYLVQGELTFKGVTRSYEHTMTLSMEDENTVHLEGESTFDVRDFGLEPPRILMLKVEPEVRVRVAIVAEKES
jgi:polyisoprenoid-binding protein YceI